MSQSKGRYIKFDALQKIRKRDGWTDTLNLIVGDQRDINNYRVTDEVFIHILQKKGILPESTTLEEDVTSTVDVGAIEKGDNLLIGTTFTEFVKQLLFKVYYPTLVPEHRTTISYDVNKYQEIGDTISLTVTLNLNRGKILGDTVAGIWDPNVLQDYILGPPTDYEYTLQNSYPPHISSSNTYSTTMTIVSGDNEISGGIMNDPGPQPKDSQGNDYLTPDAGVPSSPPYETDFIIGVYPVYATTENLATETKQPLQSLQPNATMELDLVGESGVSKQFFDIPNDFDTISEVLIFNTLSNQYDPTNQLSTFTKTWAPNKTIHGNTVWYNRYTNNTANRGPIKIKIKF